MMLKGRNKIISEFTSADLLDTSNVVKLVNTSMSEHIVNKQEIDFLIEYKNGSQPILQKVKTIRPEVNNKLVINHAQMATRMVTGYFLGTPIQYIQSGDGRKEDVELLNRYVAYEDKASTDKEIGEYQSICGTAYRIIFTDGQFADEVPFEDRALNPSTTYVVYENTIAEKPLLGVTYYTLLDDDGKGIGKKIYAYTEFGMYEFITNSEDRVDTDTLLNFTSYNVGGVPIVEYPNNMWRIGDWELCIGLMDAINALNSGRLDDIDQIVQSLLVFINADIDSDGYDEMREAGVVVLKNTTTNKTEVKTIVQGLDHGGMNLFAEELEHLLYAMLGIPDRNARGGGGDTGQAVELRDGWADLEVVARNKELTYKKSEKQALKIILNIMNNKLGTKISLMDIDIKFTRNKSNNLLVKTQGYMNLMSTRTLSPADCLTIVDLVSDVNEYVARGESFWGDKFAGLNDEKEEVIENNNIEDNKSQEHKENRKVEETNNNE